MWCGRWLRPDPLKRRGRNQRQLAGSIDRWQRPWREERRRGRCTNRHLPRWHRFGWERASKSPSTNSGSCGRDWPSSNTKGGGRSGAAGVSSLPSWLLAAFSCSSRRAKGSAVIGGSRRGARLLSPRGCARGAGDQIRRATGSTPCSIRRFNPARARSASCAPKLWLHCSGLLQSRCPSRGVRLASRFPRRGMARGLRRSR